MQYSCEITVSYLVCYTAVLIVVRQPYSPFVTTLKTAV